MPLCPVCLGTSTENYAEGYDYEYETCSNKWSFSKCCSCGHVWLNPRPADDALSIIYPSNYYSYSYKSKVHPVALWAKTVMDKAKLKKIAALAGKAPDSYLDVGCGDGRYLRVIENMGLPKDKIYGVELDKDVVDRLRAEGFNAYYKRIEDCNEIRPESIAFVTMFHVIEHVAEPKKIFHFIHDILSEDGLFAVETPNIDSWDAKIFKATWWGGYHIPRHWNLFSTESLTRLFNDSGFDVVHVGYQTGHSFWLYSFHHLFKYGKNMPRLAKWFDPMGNLMTLIFFTMLDKIRAFLGFKTSSVLIVGKKKTPIRGEKLNA